LTEKIEGEITMLRKFFRDERGAVAAVSAVYLVVAIGALALAIDLGHMFLVKAELQRAADSAALGGALRLMTPSTGVLPGVTAASPDCARAVSAAQTMGTRNSTDSQTTTLANIAISVGTWNGTTFTETGCANPYTVNAVQAVASRTINIFFGAIFTGSATQALSAQATVLVGPVGGLPPGFKSFPLAVDSDKLPSNGQKLVIHLNPTPGDDGCWHTYFWQNTSANLLSDIVNGNVDTPLIKVGDMINVSEGVVDSVLKDVGRVLHQNGGTMDVVLPVIPPDAHTGQAEVQGFAGVRMKLVDSQGSDKRIEFETINNKLSPTTLPGGGTYYGLSTGSPRLVN
jgi:Flp pilus assembly protein TadG